MSARQIADDLRRRIEAGEFPPDTRVPSETKLMEQYGTRSKGTLREVRMILEGEGLVYNRHGSGTYVRRFKRYDRYGSKRHRQSLRPAGTSPTEAEAESQGIRRVLNLLDVDTIPAVDAVAELLGVDVGTSLVRRRHLITLNGDPAQTADSYFRADQVEGSRIVSAETIPGGVHAELAAVLGRALTGAEETFVARMPTPAEKEVLSLLPGTPVVEMTRVIYAGEQPVEVTRWLFDAGWHRFTYDVPMD